MVPDDIEIITREIVKEELEGWADYDRVQNERRATSPPIMIQNMNKVHSKSAQQLPKKFSRIEESEEEDSPANVPRHNIPPQSYVNSRNSVLASEASYQDLRSAGRHVRYSEDPRYDSNMKVYASEPNTKDVYLRQSKDDRLRDYLKDKFRPPSSNSRSPSKLSARSISERKSTPDYKPNLENQAVSFGIGHVRNDSSLGRFKGTIKNSNSR